MPSFDFTIGDYTLVPNAFWGGAAFPLVVFGFLYFWPWLERRLTGDHAFHNLLDRPRDAPVRTGVGVGMISWVVLVFLAGGSDRVDVLFGICVHVADLGLPRARLGPAAAVRLVHVVGLQGAAGERAVVAAATRRRPRRAWRGSPRREPAAEPSAVEPGRRRSRAQRRRQALVDRRLSRSVILRRSVARATSHVELPRSARTWTLSSPGCSTRIASSTRSGISWRSMARKSGRGRRLTPRSANGAPGRCVLLEERIAYHRRKLAEERAAAGREQP